jgi:undecaprenyl-diphosphatase
VALPALSRARSGVRAWVRRTPGPRLELAELVALLAVAALGWTFLELYEAVREGASLDLDTRIMLALRDPADASRPLGPGWLETAMRDATALGGTLVVTFLTLAVAGYLLLAGKRGAALFVLVSIAGAALLSTVLKEVLGRDRPPFAGELAAELTSSFPSGHTTGAAAAYLTLGVLTARFVVSHALKIYLVALAVAVTVAVGISRVYLGVHWPSDVLAGWTLGGGWALCCWTVARLLQDEGRIERTPEEGGG